MRMQDRDLAALELGLCLGVAPFDAAGAGYPRFRDEIRKLLRPPVPCRLVLRLVLGVGAGRGERWLVDGANGENAMRVQSATLAEALRLAC
ncbi:MAG TPA: hypothetical protein VFE78_06490 [Gemmataceae bacterium]|jgi:hypothetical protein|nr:hypothetical protein [Gemmataceae bacterium]